jgi:two-component system OmpR family response regulator
MSASVAMLITRADFSIGDGDPSTRAEREERFFRLLCENSADAIVLDLSDGSTEAKEAISKMRKRASVPIIVVTDASDDVARQYRFLGAAECVSAPVNLWNLTAIIKQLKELWRDAYQPEPALIAASIPFGRLEFDSDRNSIANHEGQQKYLTTCESRVLTCFLNRPRKVISREALLDAVYDQHRPVGDRAIDVLINRLRKKLRALGGAEAADYIRTEFRAGYSFVGHIGASLPRSQSVPTTSRSPHVGRVSAPGIVLTSSSP